KGQRQVDLRCCTVLGIFGLKILDMNFQLVVTLGKAGIRSDRLEEILVLYAVDDEKANQLRRGGGPTYPGEIAELVVGLVQGNKFPVKGRAGAWARHNQIDWQGVSDVLLGRQGAQAVELGGGRR